jgi:methyl-accepting chemotaxis protein WspA
VKITVKNKIYGLAVLAAVLPVLVMLVLLMQFRTRVSEEAEREMTALARLHVTQSVRFVYAMCETVNDLVQAQVNRSLEVAHRILSSRGAISLASPAVSWEAVNQVTRQTQAISLPRMLVGGQWLGQVRDMRAAVPVVDEAQRLAGSTVTLFQRMNEQGDMLRIATNVPAGGGQRAIGTYIPAVLPDGTPNPVVATVLQGQTYRGMAQVLNTSYLGAYEPLREGGRIAGMLFAGVRIDGIEALRRTIMGMVLGRSGYAAVVGGKGEQRGRYVISKDGKRDGEYILDARDTSGRLFVQDELRNSMALPKGEVFVDNYTWQNPGEDRPRAKMAGVMYFQPWDWMINANVYQDDYQAAVDTVRNAMRTLTLASLLGGGLMLALALALAFFMGARLGRPIEVVTRLANQIAGGDLRAAKTAAKAVDGNHNGRRLNFPDETDELLGSFRTMAVTLEGLVGQVQSSGIQVTTSATEIAASARQLEASVAEQAASTREVSATTAQISTTSTELLRTMDGVSETVSTAVGCAESGHSELGGMEAAMRQLAKSTASISSRLGVISERANKISTVVTTINKISDQTALLSLNAAIEAEKAGEFGKGFSVVAREISRLADQTAVATEDIEGMVREMQASVSTGVMEMDKFSDEVRRRVEDVNKVAAQLGQTIDQVRALGPQFETAREGVNAQTQGAQQISEAMAQLAETAAQSKESLAEFKQATEQLNNAVQGLQSQVSRFRIGE